MYYNSNKGEKQEESQALFPPLMHRRERRGNEEEGADEAFLNARLRRRIRASFYLIVA